MTLRQFVKIFLMRPGLFYHAINEDWFYLTINNNLVSHITSLFFADEIKPHPIPYQIESPDQWFSDKNCKNTPSLKIDKGSFINYVNMAQRTEGRLNLNFQVHLYGVAFLNP